MGDKVDMDHGNLYENGADVGNFEGFEGGNILETEHNGNSETWDWDPEAGNYVGRTTNSHLTCNCILTGIDGKCARWVWTITGESEVPPHDQVQTGSGQMGH